MKFLTRPQMTSIIMLADEAYAHQVKSGFHRPRGDISKSADLSAWRHAVQLQVTGNSSLTMCVNEHFEHLMGKFCELAGRDAEAFNWNMRGGPVPGKRTEALPMEKKEIPDTLHNRNLWASKLKTLSETMRKPYPAYALGILKKQNHLAMGIERYTANALRKAFFSLNYSAQRQARATAAATNPDDPF